MLHSRDDVRPGESRFHAARRLVTHHDQWVMVHDFLVRLTDAFWRERARREVAQAMREHVSAWLRFPNIPIEFSVAVYRFGHSMVRRGYKLNRRGHPAGREIPVFDVNGGLDLTGFSH